MLPGYPILWTDTTGFYKGVLIMRMTLRSMKWLLLISGMLFSMLGITMLFMPLANLTMVAVIIGIGMLVSGFSEVVSYFDREKPGRSGMMLVSGILSILFGLWTILGIGIEALRAIIPYIFAVWVMTSGIARAVSATSNQTFGWGWLITVGIVGTIFGFILLFSPLLAGILISVSLSLILTSHGIGNIIVFFRMNKAENVIRRS